ncbi:MAG: DinB family protein [Anaerolineales bacterium]
MPKNRISIETGNKWVFASAVDWPGWCRKGRSEIAALTALLESAPHYQDLLTDTGIDFQPPQDIQHLVVIERIQGSSTTDFGAPDASLLSDSEPVSSQELDRWLGILSACWKAFDAAVQNSTGKELRKGPRGGGRDLDQITQHVLEGDQAYLRRLAWKYSHDAESDLAAEMEHIRQQITLALENACSGNLPESGPRGGKIWTPRFFIRRVAWHVLDHAWEIEDRTIAD